MGAAFLALAGSPNSSVRLSPIAVKVAEVLGLSTDFFDFSALLGALVQVRFQRLRAIHPFCLLGEG